ncbi:hypothetical protein PDJAM_G00005390 [Pangasius djambal]|uniref:Uncharacterized protein n=1 Tax=Pangasius djambal TaxID=1691987 RepID=A0ACC5XYS9_9TELE|nr:hypothetical protein [Pangasius djambal]
MISTALSRTHVTTTSTISSALATTQTGDMIRVRAAVHITAIIRLMKTQVKMMGLKVSAVRRLCQIIISLS